MWLEIILGFTFSFIFRTNATLIGIVKTRIGFKLDLELMCVQNVDVKFFMTNAHKKTTQIQHDSHKYILNATRNVLTIKSLNRTDIANSYFCNSSSGIQIYFKSQVLPYVNETNNESIEVTEDFPVKISCHLYAGNENDQNINWTWKFKNKTILQKACAASIVSNSTESTLMFSETPLIGDGEYQCIATNMYGSFGRTINLKVKSRFSLIWPFVSALFVIFVLTILLLIYQIKKHKLLSQVNKAE